MERKASMETPTRTPLHDDLRAVVGDDGLITQPEELLPYECDALTVARVQPSAPKTRSPNRWRNSDSTG